MRLRWRSLWKLAAGYAHHPPPVPYATMEEWLAH
jgi:hypothetical protein